MTGADNRYTFFAPRVPDEVVVAVATLDAQGRRLPARPSPREERLRVSNYVGFLVQQGVPRLAAWTLANDAFAHAPRARTARVVFSVHRMPTMAAYRAGRRPVDQAIYEGAFLSPTGR